MNIEKEINRLKKNLESLTIKETIDNPEILNGLARIQNIINEFFRVIKPISRPLCL